MRIAIVTLGFSHDVNDWCTPALVELVRGLAAYVEVDIYALVYPHETRRYCAHGARVFSFGWARPGPLVNRINALRAFARFNMEHKQRPYDVIHAVWGTLPATFARWVSARSGLPILLSLFAGEMVYIPHIRYGGLRTPRARRQLSANLAAAEIITAGSAYASRATENALGHHPRTLPFGVNLNRFQPDGPVAALSGNLRLLTVASLNRVKGHETALSALEILQNLDREIASRLHYHIIGEEQDGGQLRTQINSRRLVSDITLHDAVPYVDLAPVYRGADILLHPSHHETQPGVALEAAACNTPVFGSSVGLLPDLASPEWTVPPGNAARLAENLLQILKSPEKWKEEARRQRDWVYRHADAADCVRSFIEFYQELRQRRPEVNAPITEPEKSLP